MCLCTLWNSHIFWTLARLHQLRAFWSTSHPLQNAHSIDHRIIMSQCLHGSQAGEKIAELHGFFRLGCVVSGRVPGWWIIPIPERLGCKPSWLTNSRGAMWYSIQSTVSCSLYDVTVYSIYMWNLDRKPHTNYCVSHEVLLDGSLLDSDPQKIRVTKAEKHPFCLWMNVSRMIQLKWSEVTSSENQKTDLDIHIKIRIISVFGWMPSMTFLIYFGIHWDFRTV